MGNERAETLKYSRTLILSIWFGFGLVNAIETVLVMHSEGMHHAWLTLFAVVLVSWLPWALATPFVLKLGMHFSIRRSREVRVWLAHLSACTAIALLYSIWDSALHVAFNPYADSSAPHFIPLLLNKFADGILSSLILYAAIVTIGYVLDSRERFSLQRTKTARLNEQLSKAQLAALRRQIEPHFLFNTLNSVSGLVREDRNDAAISMIAGLSDLLRRVLHDTSNQQTRLIDEIEFARGYLEIQSIRFSGRLHFKVDVPDNLYGAQVPVLLLQPLVENAVLHGVAKRAAGGTIHISASLETDVLIVGVDNDGPSLPFDWNLNQSGIGLSNVRSRLMGLYGDAYDLCVQDRQGGGVRVSVRLPFAVLPASEVLTS